MGKSRNLYTLYKLLALRQHRAIRLVYGRTNLSLMQEEAVLAKGDVTKMLQKIDGEV
ncbi:MAG: hypothetical protein LBD43_00235 [Holosporales bacterium]|nr:hypothetical protein [Holosporales bacterium]